MQWLKGRVGAAFQQIGLSHQQIAGGHNILHQPRLQQGWAAAMQSHAMLCLFLCDVDHDQLELFQSFAWLQPANKTSFLLNLKSR